MTDWYSASVKCSDRERLKTEVARSLDGIVESADRFHDALTAVRLGSVTVLDQKLRNAIAAKELALEEFLVHCSDHGCWRPQIKR